MNNTLILIMRNGSRRSLITTLMLLTASSAFSADTTRSTTTSQNAASQQAADTTVQKELQKLFQQSGTEMPSLRNKDLPYANSPQMNRVRRIQEKPRTAEPPRAAQAQASPPEKKKKGNLLSRFFGRFRRQKPVEDEAAAVSEPPAIVGEGHGPTGNYVIARPSAREQRPVTTLPQSGGTRQQATAQTRRPTGQVPALQVSRPTAPPMQNRTPAPAQRPARSQQSTPDRQPTTAQQPARSPQPAPKAKEIPRLDFTQDEEPKADAFVSPFEDQAAASDEDGLLDLDAIVEIPQAISENHAATEAAVESAVEEVQELVEQETSADSPYTGLTLREDDEWENPFAASDAAGSADQTPAAADGIELEDNPFFLAEQALNNGSSDAEEATSADGTEDRVRITPRSRRQSSVGETRERIGPEAAENPFAETDAAESPEQKQPVQPQWRARLASDRSTASVARNRRLATADRAPAARTEAERWRPSADSESDSSAKAPTFADRIDEATGAGSAELSPHEIRRRKIEARGHLSGFMGFCPVALRESRDLVDASSEYAADFGRQTYQFSSEQARARFDADPSRYAPAAGGADVVALVNSGEHHAGSLRFAMWYRDRLYLFQSRETMRLFRENPASFADQY